MALAVVRKVKKRVARLHVINIVVAAGVISGLGVLSVLVSHADTLHVTAEAETGVTAGNAGSLPVADAAASGGQFVRFGMKDPNPKARNLIIPGLADPDIYKESDDLFFVSGTRQNPFEPFPIYKSTDLATFTPLRTYNPSEHDPAHDYCYMWAPDITKRANVYYFYFTARVVNKGTTCPATGTEATTFYATATDNTLDFGTPQYINKGSSDPRTYPSADCPDEGCNYAIRLDASLFSDGKHEWLHYVWFDKTYGSVISAFPLDDPGAVFRVSRPSAPEEASVNEAPAVFSRNGKYYLFYSQGTFFGQYAMRYIMSDSVATLTRSSSSTAYKFSMPLQTGDGKILENHGHNAIVERGGQYYVLYHVGEFDAAGKFTGARSTYIQPISFNADGTINSINIVNLRWPDIKNSVYSLDVKTSDGSWVTDCLNGSVLADKATATFNEVCVSASNRIVRKYDITAFRINYLDNTSSVTKSIEQPYDGQTDTLDLK